MCLAYLSECLADTSPAAWLLQRQHSFQFEGEIHTLVTLSHESGSDGHLSVVMLGTAGASVVLGVGEQPQRTSARREPSDASPGSQH